VTVNNNITKLSALVSGDRCRVITIDKDPEIRSRLNTMGISSGSAIEVLTGAKDSNFLVGVGNTRIALEFDLTAAITVQKI
jgi:Fe2+ transport system protein FeoA